MASFLRMQFSCEVSADSIKVHIGQHEGSYHPWWSELRLEVYGQKSNATYRLLGGKSDPGTATLDAAHHVGEASQSRTMAVAAIWNSSLSDSRGFYAEFVARKCLRTHLKRVSQRSTWLRFCACHQWLCALFPRTSSAPIFPRHLRQRGLDFTLENSSNVAEISDRDDARWSSPLGLQP